MTTSDQHSAGCGPESLADQDGAQVEGVRKQTPRFIRNLAAARSLLLNKWTVSVTVGLLFVAWFAGMPRGELRLASFPSVAQDEEKIVLATTLFQRADAAVADAEKHHRQLSFAIASTNYDIEIPPPAAPKGSDLRTFVSDLSLDTAGNAGGTNFSISYNALAILEKTYQWIGKTDYFVVIRDLQSEKCSDSGETSCWRMVAQYWPSLMRPSEFSGTKDQLARDLAVLVMRGAAHNQGVTWRRQAARDEPPPFLLADATPNTMESLESAAKGIEILTIGESHPKCQGRSEAECLGSARAEFDLSMALDESLSPAAAYGLALIELDSALRAARKLAVELEVETFLTNAEKWTVQASGSRFLRSLMKSERLATKFGLLELNGVSPGEHMIDVARRFACALAEYRRANWKSCLEQIKELEDFPAPLRPYLEAAFLDSSFYEAVETGASLAEQLDALKKRLPISGAEAPSNSGELFMLRRVMLRHACRRQGALSRDEFEFIAQEAAHDAPNQILHNEAIILASACRQGQNYPGENEIATIIAEVDAMPEGKERRHYELLLSQYWIRRGKMDLAFALAKSALELPWTRFFVRQAPEFAPMIESDPHGDAFIRESFAISALTDLESCYWLE